MNAPSFASRCCAPSLAILLALPSGQALAQAEMPATDVTGQSQTDDLVSPDIIVTARKRAETVQNVPLAINVVTPAAITAIGASSLTDLSSVAPGVTISRSPSASEVGITLRGLGSNSGAPSFDTSVGLFIDGVYAGRSREFASSMFDVERIEVIKGTQAALLGKNTSLGAINLITRKPDFEFGMDYRASYDVAYGSYLLGAAVDIPLGESFAVRLSGQSYKTEGWVRNTFTGEDAPEKSSNAGRIIARWEPGSTFDLTAYAQYDETKLSLDAIELINPNPLAQFLQAFGGAPGTLDGKLDRRTHYGLADDSRSRLRLFRSGVTANLDLDFATLTSITGLSHYTDRARIDADFVAGDYLIRATTEDATNFSQELRLVSNGGNKIDYLVGALYVHNELEITEQLDATYPFNAPAPLPPVPFAGAFKNSFDQTATTGSFFGQLTGNISDKFSVTGGIRYTIENKKVDLSRITVTPGVYSTIITPPFAPFSLERTDKPFDYSVGVQYKVTPDIMLFASYGKGTKSGGFANGATNLAQSAYGSESAKTFEAGLKAQDPQRRWLFNLSAFSTDVDKFQVVTFNGVAFGVTNSDLRSRGFELDAYWNISDALRVYVNNTFADAYVKGTNSRVPLSPKWKGNVGFAVNTPINDDINFIFDGSVEYRSRQFYQQVISANLGSPAFETLNLSIGVESDDGQWDFRVIGRNLLDSIAPAFAFPTPVIAGNISQTAEPGRTVAFQISGKF